MRKVRAFGLGRCLLGAGICILLWGQISRGDFTFGEPTNLGLSVRSTDHDFSPSISADGLSLFFTSNRSGGIGGLDVWVTTRETTDDPWGEPVNLGPTINSPLGEYGVSISSDGLSLYFDTSQLGPITYWNDLWVATRATTDDGWSNPVSLGSRVNSLDDDYSPSISSDGLSLFFMSNRSGNYDLWVTTRATTDDDWSNAVNLGPTVNSSSADADPGISADGRMLFFSSRRPGGSGDADDILVTMRETTDDPWGEPVNLGSVVNSLEKENYSNISADGSTLFFCTGSPTAGTAIWQAPILPVVDFTGDSRVDIKDLVILIEHWGKNEPSVDMGPMPWGDGVVDAADLEILMSYWGKEVYNPHFIAHWKLDETEGNIVHDCIGGFDATLIGDAIWESDGGQIDGALRFNGTNGYIKMPPILNPNDGVFSIFVWIKGGAPGQAIISQKDGADWLLTDTQGCLITALISTGRSPGDPLRSEMVVTDGHWHRIGLVWDGAYRSLYVDDELAATDAAPQNNFPGSQGNLYIGAAHDLHVDTLWSGFIDDARVYDWVVEP